MTGLVDARSDQTFGSFMLEFERTIEMMGTGLATAVLFDATIVRLLLVPATMELLGDRWWLPRWLDRHPLNLDVEGHITPTAQGDDQVEPDALPQPDAVPVPRGRRMTPAPAR